MRWNFALLFLLGMLLSGCVLSTTSRMPKGEYISLSGTPVLIEKTHRFDPRLEEKGYNVLLYKARKSAPAP